MTKVKILGIVGSPRHHSNTEVMVREALKGAEETGNVETQILLLAGKRILGKNPEFRGMVSPADSEYLVNAGIPSVMFGPGYDELAHTSNEWVAIDDILTATKIYAAIMLGDEIN